MERVTDSMSTATWIIALAAIVQAALAAALVWATSRYVVLTSRLATSSEEQIRMDKTPNLIFEVREKAWVLSNIGSHGVLIDKVSVQRTSSDWKPQHNPITLSDPGQGQDWFVSNWKRIVQPNDSIVLSHQVGRHGRFICRFTFYHGSTGTTQHELAVRLNVDMSDNTTPFGQELQALPVSGESEDRPQRRRLRRAWLLHRLQS